MPGGKAKGYFLGSVAAATYGMNPLFALPLYQCGMNVHSVLLLRYLIALPIVGVMIAARGRSFRVAWCDVPMLALMGVLMALSSLALFASYTYMDAGIASTMLFVYPIMVAILMTILFHERLTLTTILCIAVALGGIVLLYKGDGNSHVSLAGTVIVMLSSLSYAIYIVGVNRSRLRDMATLTITFYVLLFGSAVFGICMLAGTRLTLPPSGQWYLWVYAVALAVFPTVISFLCTTSAIHYIGSTPTAILGALEPVTAVFFGVTVFGETLTIRDIAGLLMIITAVSFVIAGSSVQPVLIRVRKLFPRLNRGKK